MHLHYQSRLQAKKALSKNGKIFGGSIMVGVAHCIDKVSIDLFRNFNCFCQVINFFKKRMNQ